MYNDGESLKSFVLKGQCAGSFLIHCTQADNRLSTCASSSAEEGKSHFLDLILTF